MTTTRVHDWGVRLSDRLRTAIEAGDFGHATQLARDGDGHARSLAREYTFMYRGLGIAIRVIMNALPDTVAPFSIESDSAALVARFRNELGALIEHTLEVPMPSVEAGSDLGLEIRATVELLTAGEAAFERSQAALAEDIIASLVRHDALRSRVLVNRKEREQYLPLHDRLVRFMADAWGFVYARCGAEALLGFHLATAEGQRAGFTKWEEMDVADFAKTSAFLLRQHMGSLDVREDEEKFTLDQSLCGSGGRLQVNGAYSGPDALPYVEEAGQLTFGQPHFPVYCSHCPVWNGVAPIRWFGRSQWVFERPAQPDGRCLLHIYKQRGAVPAEYEAKLR
ncbi:MAG: hypothetical protein HY943_06635 [Gammaproteobacteria bacterium]|nr:hypothetical protein [Gammaproteobacteria bacterium]